MRENDDFTPEQALHMLETYGDSLPPEFQAFCLCLLERFDEALPLFNEALTGEPDSWQLWYSKGFALLSLEQYAEAVLAFERAMELNPTHDGPRQGRDEALKALSVENDDQTLYRWFDIPHPMACRRFLEQHPELLAPHIRELVELIYPDLDVPNSPIRESLAEVGADSTEKIDQIRERIELLRDVHRRGGTQQAIRDACVDTFGGIVLKMPPWLEQEIGRLSIFTFAGPGAEASQKIAAGLQAIIKRAETEPDLPREILAHLYVFLYEMLENAANAGDTEALEASILSLDSALSIYTSERYLRSYAMLQHKRGLLISYQALVNYASTRAFNVENFDKTVNLPGLRGEAGKRRLEIIFTEAYQKALMHFRRIRDEVKESQGPLEAFNTFVDEETLLQAAEKCGPGHAIVYLAATSSGGIAVSGSASRSPGTCAILATQRHCTRTAGVATTFTGSRSG